MNILSFVAGCALVAGCVTSSEPADYDPGATVLEDGTTTFSPVTDAVGRFYEFPNEYGPEPVVLHEATIGTGQCSMLVDPNGQSASTLVWQFRAPDGRYFDSIDIAGIESLVTVDHRAGSGASAEASIHFGDYPFGTSIELVTVKPTGPMLADYTKLTRHVRDDQPDELKIEFSMNNFSTTDTSALAHIYVQTLRQCPGQPAPFRITTTTREKSGDWMSRW